jgi:NADH dehydrogenase
MARVTFRSNFRRIDPGQTTIMLLEGGRRILSSFDEKLSAKAERRLASLGVQVRTGVMVDRVDAQGVLVGGQRIESATVLWTAGVQASPVVRMLGVQIDRTGRACVGPSLGVTDHANIFVIGDCAMALQDGKPLPGVAQVAIQQGAYAGKCIAADIAGIAKPPAFRYFDKGNMAVVGKNFAILQRGNLRTSGTLTWFVWALIHVIFLPQLQNRIRVQTQWLWSYLSGQRSSRLIPERAAPERSSADRVRSIPASIPSERS